MTCPSHCKMGCELKNGNVQCKDICPSECNGKCTKIDGKLSCQKTCSEREYSDLKFPKN